MEAFLTILRGVGVGRLLVMGGVISVLAAVFMMISNRLNTPDMALLYSSLEPQEAGKIVAKLELLDIPMELKGDGTQVFVPADQAPRARMLLAEDGLPSSGTIGYEIFDKSDPMGTTGFLQDINHVRALEGELSKTIRTIVGVKSARVHLVMPKRELFSKKTSHPTGSVFLKMNGAVRLSKEQVRSVQHLVAAAVPNLMPQHITIIDDRGTLLSMGNDGDNPNITGNNPVSNEEFRFNLENKISQTIESLVERIVGPGKVRAEISLDLNFDRITENSEIFDPNGQVVRSTQKTENGSQSQETADNGTVSAQNAVPQPTPQPGAATGGGQDNAGANTARSKNNTNQTEETINYEVSKTNKVYIKESGTIRRLSVAVIVDGKTETKDGKPNYTPRTKDELKQITNLVKTAVGFKDDRGDTIEVVNMPFASPPESDFTERNDLIMGFEKHHIIRFIEILVMALLGILTLFSVVKPILQQVLETIKSLQPPPPPPMPTMVEQRPRDPNSPPGMNETEEELVARQKVAGQLRANTIRAVEEIVSDHPQETVSMIRSWLNEG